MTLFVAIPADMVDGSSQNQDLNHLVSYASI